MQSRIREATVLAVAILGLGAFLYAAALHAKDRERTVSVRGLAEREVAADFAIWPVVFKEAGNDLAALSESVRAKSEAVEKFLLDGGIAPEEIGKSAPDVVDAESEFYGNERRSRRYVATSVTTVATKDVAKMRALMERQGELLKKGIAFSEGDYRFRTIYAYNALNEIKPEMIDEATRNARAAAEKFARNSGSRIGKIKNATQGLFTVENRDENTPYVKRVRVVTNVQYYLED